MAADTDTRVVDNAPDQHYELWVGDDLAVVIESESMSGVVVLIPTEIGRAFEGSGFATRLVEGALQDFRARA